MTSPNNHAFIYDHVRTPRGRGKQDGSLHQASPAWLLRALLRALQARSSLDTALVDDVVLGCVTPVGEQGADIARTAVLDAEWAQTVAGVTQSRFCASGLESVNLAAAKVASGFEDLVVAGGVESMSRWPMGSDGGAWFMDPRINQKLGFVPQGVGADLIATLEGFSRVELDAFALRSHQRAAAARARRSAAASGGSVRSDFTVSTALATSPVKVAPNHRVSALVCTHHPSGVSSMSCGATLMVLFMICSVPAARSMTTVRCSSNAQPVARRDCLSSRIGISSAISVSAKSTQTPCGV